MSAAALTAALILSIQSPAPQSFDVAPGPAVASLNRLAAQGGLDIVVTADFGRRRTPRVRGRMTPEAALDRMLRPLGARAVRIGERMYRIEPAPPSRPPPPRPAAPQPPAPRPVEPAPVQLSEVVVTAAPRSGLADAPGRSLLDPGALERLEGAPTSDALADLTASIDSTRQGPGRNKLFVRGLADSAMNGPLQATVGQYFGDLRLNSGSPDPDLALIDIRRIEVFEGPQGSRFGVGAIGGVLRIEPRPPVSGETSSRLTLGGGLTSGGDDSAEASLVLNQPTGSGTAARLVAYARRDGGYLESPALGLTGADHVETAGVRAGLRAWRGRWTLDLVGLAQRVEAGDTQSVRAGDGLVKTKAVLEPYRSAIALVGVSARRDLGAVTFASAASLSRQRLDERFDASQPAKPSPAVVDRVQTADTAAAEIRWEGGGTEGPRWSGGASLAFGRTLVERRRLDLSPSPAPVSGADLRRSFADASLFGEVTLIPASGWRIGVGGRASLVRIDSDIETIGPGSGRGGADRKGADFNFSPSLTARWEASSSTTVFARLERAIRPAGVTESSGAFERYRGDRITLTELGAEITDWGGAGVSAEISAGLVDWRDVQAEVVTPGGDLATDNVGDGRIAFVSVKAAWRPHPALDISGGLFLNESRLTPTRFTVIGAGPTEIPNVAPLGAQLSVDVSPGRLGGLPLRLGADLRYVGQSRLGVGPALDVPQGGYLRTELTARLGGDRRAATLRISNPFDTQGTRYGIGSPYQLSEPQASPLRPLTVRLAFEAAF